MGVVARRAEVGPVTRDGPVRVVHRVRGGRTRGGARVVATSAARRGFRAREGRDDARANLSFANVFTRADVFRMKLASLFGVPSGGGMMAPGLWSGFAALRPSKAANADTRAHHPGAP